MKSQQKLILIALIIVLLSIIALLYFSNNSYEKKQSVAPLEKFNLMEVKSTPHPFIDTVYGQIVSNYKMDVEMKVSGKIDNDNHRLAPGTVFKKNDLLIKVDRLAILYELLMARLDYKQLVNKAIQEFPSQIINKKEKWERFKDQIHKTHSLPPLPDTEGKEEDNYFSQTGIDTQYYKIKKLELSAENYIYAAPFDGIIIKSSIHPGAEIKKDVPLMTISKQGSHKVKVNIPISRVHDYKKSKSANFLNAELDTIGHGSFLRVSAHSPDSSMIEVIYSLSPQSSKNLGKVVRVVPQKKQVIKGIKIPKTAVNNNRVLVYISNKLLKVPVQAISTQNDSVYVSGLPKHCFVAIPGE